MLDVEIRLFRYFVAVVQERHFTRAAIRLGISPPTLTIQIQKLERLIGAKLIRRGSHSMFELTAAGKRFYVEAEKLLAQAENARLAVGSVLRGDSGRLEVGYMMTAAGAGVLQRLIGNFQQTRPEVEIILRRMVTLDQIKAILNHELDFGFARPPATYPPELRGTIVLRQPIMVALPKTHPLARQDEIRPEELKDEFFVNTSVEMELGFQRHAEAIAKIGKFTLKISKRVADMPTVLTYVSLGYGLAIVTEGLSTILFPNVVYRYLVGENTPVAPLALIYRRKDLSPPAESFVEFVKSQV